MLQIQAYAPGFLLGLVTVAALAVKPAREPELSPGEAVDALAPIPASQQDLDFDLLFTDSTVSSVIPNSVVTINNGGSTGPVIVTFSADVVNQDEGDIFALSFSIDSGPCQIGGGPPNFNAGSTRQDTRTAVHVFTIGPGTHTIQPCWRVQADSDGPQLLRLETRLLIAEGRTK